MGPGVGPKVFDDRMPTIRPNLQETDRVISTLMGNDVSPRRAMIEEYGSAFDLTNLDI